MSKSKQELEPPTASIDEQVAELEGAMEDYGQHDLEVFYHDTGGYFVNVDANKKKYYKRTEPQLRRALRRRGLYHKARPDKGEFQSQIDAYLEANEMENRVFYAGPLSGYKAGVTIIQGEPALITRTHHFLQGKSPSDCQTKAHPECPGFPVYYGITKRMFDDEADGISQIDYWFGWVQYALECLHNYKTFPGLALAIAGDTSSGKTLQTDVLTYLFGGLSGRPYAWMIGQDQFNPELSQAPLWLIDDEAADGSHKARNNLKAQVKKIVANSSLRVRGMHTPAIDVSFFARLVFLLNLEESNIIVLPPIDSDLDDKMMLLKAYKHPMPMPTRRILDRGKFWDTLTAELPYFVHWILNKYELPETHWSKDRYFVHPYKHPEIMSMLHSLSKASQIWKLIQKYVFEADSGTFGLTTKTQEIPLPKGVWVGSASDLLTVLNDDDSGLSKIERDLLPKGNFLGSQLKECSKHYGRDECRYLGRNRSGTKRLWLLCAPDKFIDHLNTDGPESELLAAVRTLVDVNQ